MGAPSLGHHDAHEPLNQAGDDGNWEMIDSVSPVMTKGAGMWLRDLASQFRQAGINTSFAFWLECYNPLAPSGSFPLVPDFPHERACRPDVVLHQFASGNATIEQGTEFRKF